MEATESSLPINSGRDALTRWELDATIEHLAAVFVEHGCEAQGLRNQPDVFGHRFQVFFRPPFEYRLVWDGRTRALIFQTRLIPDPNKLDRPYQDVFVEESESDLLAAELVERIETSIRKRL